MKELLKFVDNYVFESQLYFRIGTLYSNEDYEVQWIHGAPRPWRLRPQSSSHWLEVRTEDLIPQMNQAQLDLSYFETLLRNNVLQQVAYANTFLKKATKIFGKDMIDEAVHSNEVFVQELEDTIKSLLKPSQAKMSEEIDQSHKDLSPVSLKAEKQGGRLLRLLKEDTLI